MITADQLGAGTIEIWDGPPPGGVPDGVERIDGHSPALAQRLVRNVTRPTLTPVIPDTPSTTTSVIVAPGGGFHFLSADNEGLLVARWLADRGITSFVLEYRVAVTPPDEGGMLAQMQALITAGTGSISERLDQLGRDAAGRGGIVADAVEDGGQAVRVVRRAAAGLGLDPGRVGLLGFSAGARVALGTLQLADTEAHPGFIGSIYGPDPSDGTLPGTVPPLFLAAAADDELGISPVPTYQRWKKAGARVEMHVYSRGGHGFGLAPRGVPSDSWIERFHDWLVAEALLG